MKREQFIERWKAETGAPGSTFARDVDALLAAERERCRQAVKLCPGCREGLEPQPGVAGNAKVVHFDGDDIRPCLAEALFK